MVQLMMLMIALALFAVAAVAVARTFLLRTRHRDQEDEPDIPLVPDPVVQQAAVHLSQVVSCPTTAHSSDAFEQLHATLRESYPNMHTRLEIIETGSKNLVFRWGGSDQEMEPALLLAHQDVVPATDADQWRFPPFSQKIEEGFIWGRGSFDAKGQLIAICEAVELLLMEGFTPKRTWYIAFGCDEEIRGSEGAAAIATFFANKGVRFAFVLDEGGVVADRFLPGFPHPIAVVGIAEKGDANITISCSKEGGHSSSPDNPTALGILGRAIWRIENNRPRPKLTPPVRLMLCTLGLHAPFVMAVPLLNSWISKPLLFHLFGKSPTLNALIRSTCAVTMAHASDAPNVVSPRSHAMVNVRMFPETSTDEILRWMRRQIKDNRISLTVNEDSRRSVTSRVDGPHFSLLTDAIFSIFPTAVPTPYLMTGGTDALWYEPLSDCVYRFTPVQMNKEELRRMHGRDERLSISNLKKAMQFYMALIHKDQ